jgi:hypothetical protein
LRSNEEEDREREREREDGYKKGGPATVASCERGGGEDGGVRPRAALLQRQGLRPGAQRGGARRRERLHTGDDRFAAASLDDPAACACVMLWCLIYAII